MAKPATATATADKAASPEEVVQRSGDSANLHNTPPAVVGAGALTKPSAPLDFASDAGRGTEGADKDSFAIPFISCLQPLSPCIVDNTIPGARAGLFHNSITNAVHERVRVVPVAFQRRYLAWMPRAAGGGFKGEYSVADVEGNTLGWVKNAEGRMVLPDGSELKDTRNHYVLVLGAAGGWSPALISLSSTQIKKSKRWLSLMQSIQMTDAKGGFFTPPTFSHIYELHSIKEQNEKGQWFGVEPTLIGPVEDAALYAAAKAFNAQVIAGKVEVAPPQQDMEAADGGGF